MKGQVLKNQGDSKFARDGNLVCTIWKDKARKKHVTVLSSQCNPVGDLENDVVKRRVKSTEGEGFEKKKFIGRRQLRFIISTWEV